MSNSVFHPLIDLHCHLRGTLEPTHAIALAAKNRIRLPTDLTRHGYLFQDFHSFLSLYDVIGRVVQKAEDLRSIAVAYLTRCAAEGARYVELMISPAHMIAHGIKFEDQMSSIDDAIQFASDNLGIQSNIVVTAV